MATDRDECGRRDACAHGLGVARRRLGNMWSLRLGRAAQEQFGELSSGGGPKFAATPRYFVSKPSYLGCPVEVGHRALNDDDV